MSNNTASAILTALSLFTTHIMSLCVLFWGAVKVFTWTRDKLSSLFAPIRYVIASLLTLLSLAFYHISAALGIIEAIRRFNVYRQRKSAEMTEGHDIGLFASVILDERTRLVLAYIFVPLYSFLGYASLGLLTSETLPSLMLNTLFAFAPPTIIRFLFKKHGIDYISEISAYMLLSFVITAVLYYAVYSLFYVPAPLTELAIYLILSYESARKLSNSKVVNCSIMSLFFIISSVRYGVRHNQTILEASTSSVIALLMVLPFLFYFAGEKNIEASEGEQILKTTEKENTGICLSNVSHNDDRSEPPDIFAHIIDTALADIGRITPYVNSYLTPEQTEARHQVERPFLKLLAAKYRDEVTRKELARHFMLYKEMTLFVIFAMLLGNDKALHAKVRTKLKERLSDGLSDAFIRKRNELWRTLSQNFYESYTHTHDLAGTLEYVFWSTLPERLRGEEVFGQEYLRQIFEYSRRAIARDYEYYARQEQK